MEITRLTSFFPLQRPCFPLKHGLGVRNTLAYFIRGGTCLANRNKV